MKNESIAKLLTKEFEERKRENSKYTMAQLGRDLGIQKDSMIAYINGDRVPNADSLVDIAKGLNISIDYLLGLSDIKKPFVENDNGIALLIGQYMRELADVSYKVDRLRCTPVNLIDTKAVEIISDINSIYFKLKKIRDGEN